MGDLPIKAKCILTFIYTQPRLDLYSRHDDIPTRDNFDASAISRDVTARRGVGVASNGIGAGNDGVSGGGGGSVGIPGAAWSIMPDSLTFNVNDQSAVASKKLVKIVNMGAKPLR